LVDTLFLEWNIVQRIMDLLGKEKDRSWSAKQIAETLKLNRHMVSGSLVVLIALNLVKIVYRQRTYKLYMINHTVRFSEVVAIIAGLLPTEVPSKATWFQAADWLMPLVVNEKIVHNCLEVLNEEGPQVFGRYLYRIYADLGQGLPLLIRDFLLAAFLHLFDAGVDYFDEASLRTFLQKYAGSKKS